LIWGDLQETINYEGKFQHYGWMAFPESTAADYAGPLSSNTSILPGDVAGNFSREAVRNIFEQMGTEVSIANFLWELKGGIKELIPKLDGNLLEKVGSNWLWWNFGVLPLVQDIKKLLTIVKTVSNRLEHLKRVNRRETTQTFKGKWVRPAVPTAPGAFGDDRYALTLHGNPTILFEEIKCRINIRVYYDLELDGADTFLKGMVSALGLNNPAGIIWEAIPFSFVIDWFTTAQEFLEDTIDTSQPFKGTIKTNGADHTLDRRVMMAYVAPTDNKGGYATFDHTLVRAYYRRPGLPNGVLNEDGLSPLQLSLSVALLAQGLGSNVRFRRR
jgi:hypothetical protein